MKKFLNISLLLLGLGLSCSLGCRSWLGPTEAVQAEPGLTAGEYLEARTSKHPATAPVRTTSAPTPEVQLVREEPPMGIRPEMVAVSQSGSSIVSRTYPWAECGVVQVDKVMPKEVGLNKPFTYTIKVANLTNTALTDITINEDLPDNFKFLSASPAARGDEDNLLSWEIPTLGPKSVIQITISGLATYIDSLKHCTTVITPVIPACATVQVIQPELKLTRTAPEEVLLCDPIQVRYIVTNSGTGYVPNVKIVETLASGLRTTGGRSEVVFDAGTLMAGQSQQFSAELRATKTGEYVSKAVANSTTGLRTESDQTRTVVSLPILAISKTGPDRQYIGRPVSYQITVTNKSDVAARNTVIEDMIPEGVISVKGTAGAKLLGPKLVWEIGTLEPDTSETVRVSLTPTKAGTLINSATASAYCADAVTSTVRTLVKGIPAVLMEVIDVDDPVRVGERATYVIRVKNQGSAHATNIRVSCILEDYVRYVSSAGATSGSQEGQTVRFLPLGTLAPGAEVGWRVVVEAVRVGDMRFKAILNMDELSRPVEETESTHLYE
ncbi:MAG: DUF11 domain-containing protein [Phycisphaerae bacterium]|nr:DUF11 domain-containing protein [Phycisphaerae bacterium]